MSLLSRDLVERIIIILAVMALVIGGYWPINHFNEGRDFYYTVQLGIDRQIPFNTYFILGYIIIFPLFYFPAYTIGNVRFLRHAAICLIPQLFLAYIIFIVFPVRIIRPEVPYDAAFNWGMNLNYYIDLPNNCFPSLHVADSVFLAAAIWHVNRKVGAFALFLSGIIAISTLFVRAHYILDVTTGAVLGIASYWIFIRPYKNPGGTLFRPSTCIIIFVGTYLAMFTGLITAYYLGWAPWAK